MKKVKKSMQNDAKKIKFLDLIKMAEHASALTKGRVTVNGFEPMCRANEYRRG